jgi:hypothetical protein
MNKRGGNIVALSIIGVAIFFTPEFVFAGKLYTSPSSGTYAVGQDFPVSVRVDTEDQAANAIEGTLTFNPSVLRVKSLSSTNSIFDLDVRKPTFSNSTGTVQWAGIVLSPGYTGSSGRVITVTFTTIAAGTAEVTLSSGSILANDGKGTSILRGLAGGKFIVTTQAKSTPAPSKIIPKATESSVPSTRNPVEIDVLPPQNFQITRIDTDATNPRPQLVFATTDEGSKEVRYMMSINDGPWSSVDAGTTAQPFVMPLQKPGTYYVRIDATDQAGNSARAQTTITITSIPPPSVEYMPRRIESGEHVSIQGHAFPRAHIQAVFEKENFFFRNCCAIYVLCKLKKLKYLFNLLRYYINYVCGLGSKYGDNL